MLLFGTAITFSAAGMPYFTGVDRSNQDFPVWRWLQEELPVAQRCVGIFVEDICVSLCRSVCVGKEAQEAGVETLEAFRGRGYAALAVAG
ncbi:MAG: hypothetical protein DBY39_01770 [Clostridiales bacterium]|nr:MAG: hypothetical protein DBY39_01770 [Clostridiales bacterium]